MDISLRIFETIFLMNAYVFTLGRSVIVSYINKALNIRVVTGPGSKKLFQIYLTFTRRSSKGS